VRPGDRGFKPPDEWCDLIPCDTFNESSVRFDMPVNNPSNSTYEWQLGTEATPRTGKAFEVDFSDYLRDNGWERHIPITLTIRTPLNSCMTHPEDTLIRVTRKLFFTEKHVGSLFKSFVDNEDVYKGVLNNIPNSEIRFILKTSGRFRGYTAPHYLMVGLPHIDTLAFPSKCNWAEVCESFRQKRVKYFAYQSCMEDVSHYLSEYNALFSPDGARLILDLSFDPPEGRKQFNFTGTLVK
jgi:hypothetical protein